MGTHQAFSVLPLLTKLPVKIDCIHVSGQRLFVGAAGGALLVYFMAEKISLIQSKKNLSKSKINQIEALPELGVIFLLADKIITIYDIETLVFVSQLSESLGCHLFATFRLPCLVDGIAKLRTFLSVVVKHKLWIYEWDDAQIVNSREVNLPRGSRLITMVWCNAELLCLGFASGYSMVNIITSQIVDLSNSASTPHILHLSPMNELFLSFNDLGTFVKYDGTRSKSFNISWIETPIHLEFVFPYILSICASGVEVRSIFSDHLVEILTIPLITRITTCNKIVVISSDRDIFQLCLRPTLDQISELVRRNYHDDAIQLLQLSTSLTAEEKSAMLPNIKKKYARWLFDSFSFDKALRYLEEAEASLEEILEFFPSLSDTSANITSPENVLLLEKSQMEESYVSLLPYLSDHRQRCIRQRNQVKSTDVDANKLLDDKQRLIDTVLLKIYLAIQDYLVSSLVRVNNYCDVKETETLLLHAKKYQELMDFYYGKSLHDKALSLIVNRIKNEDSSFTPDSLLKYLLRLDSENIDLILEYAQILYPDHQELFLQVFIRQGENENDLKPHAKVIDLFSSLDAVVSIPYLEYIIEIQNDTSEQAHSSLASLYLQCIQQGLSDDLSDIYQSKLRSFLQESDYYKPSYILSLLPVSTSSVVSKISFVHEKAILYGKMGQHAKAIQVLVDHQVDDDYIEKFCLYYFNRGVTNIYLLLLANYLELGEEYLSRCFQILTRNQSRIDPLDCLKLFVIQFNQKDLLYPPFSNFFQNQIRMASEQRHFIQIQQRLQHIRMVELRQMWLSLMRQRVTVQEDSICPICRKRLGNLALIFTYKNNQLVHFVCKENSQRMLETN